MGVLKGSELKECGMVRTRDRLDDVAGALEDRVGRLGGMLERYRIREETTTGTPEPCAETESMSEERGAFEKIIDRLYAVAAEVQDLTQELEL